MSFLNRMKAGLKSVANRVTGGYGELTIELDKAGYRAGETLKARILLSATEELKVTNITVHAQGVASASYSEQLQDERGRPIHTQCNYSDYTLKEESEICGEMELAQGESKSFEYEVKLPESLPATYAGENIRNTYYLKVHVDIPWGVDLRETEEFEIQVTPRASESDEIRVQRRERLCGAELFLPSGRVKPGEYLDYELLLKPRDSMEIKKVTIGLRSLETMPGKAGRDCEQTHGLQRAPQFRDEPYLEPERCHHQTEGDTPKLHWTDEQLDVSLKYQEEELWENHHLSGEEVLKEQVRIPEEYGTSFRYGDLEHRIVLVVKVELNDRESILFEQDVVVSNVEKSYVCKWGTQQPIAVRDREFGHIELLAWGKTEVRPLDASLGEKECQARVRHPILTELSTLLGNHYKSLDMTELKSSVESVLAEAVRTKMAQEGFELIWISVDEIVLTERTLARIQAKTN